MDDVNKIIKDIEKKSFKPLYFLMGEEPYYVDKITNSLLDNVLAEEEKSFNLDILYGKDTDINQIISIARQFPLMAEFRLVVIKEAQDIKDIEELVSYLKGLQEQTILVVNYKYKSLDKRKALYKEMQKSEHCCVLESVKVKDYQIASFLKNLVKLKNRTINDKAISMLVDFLGNDLSKIENEVDKLCILVQDGEEITEDIIEKNIGISKDYNNFEFVKAISSRDQVKAYRIAKYFYENPKTNPPVVTVAVLYNFFSLLLQYHGVIHKNKSMSVDDVAKHLDKKKFQLNDCAVASKYYTMKQTSRNINLLKDLDLKLKGVGASNLNYIDLINEFLAKIFI